MKPESVKHPPTAVISEIYPLIDGGLSPSKAIVGEPFAVSANIFKDGHDIMRARLRWRGFADGTFFSPQPWEEAPMEHLENDRWQGSFTVENTGMHEFLIEGWGDRFASWVHAFEKKCEADDEELPLVLQEGALIVEKSAEIAKAGQDQETFRQLFAIAETMRKHPPSVVADLVLSEDLAFLMALFPDRDLAYSSQVVALIVEPVLARCSAWYEFFPRNAFGDPARHSGFRDCLPRLDQARDMGFNVIYLPPIHPIGESNRKGKNNSVTCQPGDYGSPWAIGGKAGGHREIEPLLGSHDDFSWFVKEAGKRGLKIALDFALNCSPDHPYVKAHPDWFHIRPDGSIMYAENPPKKYQDIYPLNFHCEDWRNLWDELTDVIRFWCGKGISVFRVDNPHTKPVSMWAEIIPAIKREFPDTIFLSEAFTRPRMMEALAKAGFSQSYTYFTWRVAKQELTDYALELTSSELKDYFRGNFWPNTPDILAEHLWDAPPAMFKIRAGLAATLCSNWGIYAGYEYCENAPMNNGKEEYLDSEKYELKARDWEAPGIRPFITELNRARRENPALQLYENLRFYDCPNPEILCYGKSTPDLANRIVVAVSLDPYNSQEGMLNLPLEELGIDPALPYTVTDLLHGDSYTWQGHGNYIALSPFGRFMHLFRLDQ